MRGNSLGDYLRVKERTQRRRERRIAQKELAVLALLGDRTLDDTWRHCLGCAFMTRQRSGDSPVCSGCYEWATETKDE